MNSMKNRLRTLEGKYRAPMKTAIVSVPEGWDVDERQDGIAAATINIAEPFEAMVLCNRDVKHVQLHFVGDLDALLADVAASSCRIGISR